MEKKNGVITLRVSECTFISIQSLAEAREWTIGHAARYLIDRGFDYLVKSCSGVHPEEVPGDEE